MKKTTTTLVAAAVASASLLVPTVAVAQESAAGVAEATNMEIAPSGIDTTELEAAVKELEGIEEIKGVGEEDAERIIAENPEVRRRVEAARRRIAAATGVVVPEEAGSEAPAADIKAVPHDAGQVIMLPDGTGTNVIDDVFFGELQWVFGRFNGADAVKDGVIIGSLEMDGKGLKFQYVSDLSCWGMGHTDYSGALACLFVCDNDNNWVGGKFDWISSSRQKRDFANIYSGYRGWTLSNTPNPCMAAFVIVSSDGKRRSNVITATWER